LLAPALAEALKQQFIVDNRPGASGNIGAAAAAKSAADGYTFLVSANPALAVNPSLYKELPYNAERDFTPVTRGVMAPMAMVVHPSVPAKTLAELVALGKTAPGKLAYGSAGTGSPTFLGDHMLEEGPGTRSTSSPDTGSGAPAPIVQRIAAEIGRAMRSRPVAEKLEAQVLVPVFDTPEQFAASLKKERDGWADFIRRNGIQPDQ